MAERDLTHIDSLDQLSREQWSKMCASSLITILGREGAKALVAGGFHHFLGAAKRAYHGHAFKFDDYRRIFDLVRLAAEGKANAHTVLR